MFVLYLSAVIEAHKFLQKENSEPEKTRKKTQKELEIKKAKATAEAQNEADEVVTELKIMHPVCSAKNATSLHPLPPYQRHPCLPSVNIPDMVGSRMAYASQRQS